MTLVDYFFGEQEPLVVAKKTGQEIDRLLHHAQEPGDQPLDLSISLLDAANCHSKDNFYTSIASLLQFPDYFGRNWDAFNDSFSESLWNVEESHWLLVIQNADLLLVDSEQRDIEILLSLFSDVCSELSRDEEAELKCKVLLLVDNIENSRILSLLREISQAFNVR